jgi:glucose/arabinose dehydrogenase
MSRFIGLMVFFGALPSWHLLAAPPEPLLTGLAHPMAATVGSDGRVYLTVAGDFDREGDGAVLVIDKNKAVPFATGLNDPAGLAAYQEWLFVADRDRIWRIDRKGKAELFVSANAFPSAPVALYGLIVDPESGILYVSESGKLESDSNSAPAAATVIYRITPQGQVSLVGSRWPRTARLRGLALDGASHLLVAEFVSGKLARIKLAQGTFDPVAQNQGGLDGLAWDKFSRLYITDSKAGRVLVVPQPDRKPVVLATGFDAPAQLCLDPTGRSLLVPDTKAGTLTVIPATVPGAEVDATPLPLESTVAFPNLKWTGWKGRTDQGTVEPLRPLVLTHAGDGSNRVFVASEHGVIHVFPNDQGASQTQVFLDLQARVSYDDNQNEEGFLGLTFHPNYKQNGEFFVFYTPKYAKLINVLSRFRVSRDNPNHADPASEEEILRIARPFWNHDGGTICFGPDGYLYVVLGDGGSANDPYDNAQNLKTLLGKVLRLDIDHPAGDKPYAIPKDNPFVNQPGARPEIWAYGLRNIWRMSFDRATGVLWAADVGQNLYEEIDLLTKGGNYGWNRREGFHPFGALGSSARNLFIEPIWEYHHDIGKSIIGGSVYRGKRLPNLVGHYLYGDYVSGRIWALRYDATEKRVVANRPIPDRNLPILSFGEDEKGEIYYMTYTPTGQGIYWFIPAKKR